jgi:hypothetical protein
MVRQVFPEQDNLPGAEWADVVAHEKRAFAPDESRQLHLDVVMPAVTGACDALGMVRLDQ